LDWWQGDSFLLRHRVLTPAFRSELGWGSLWDTHILTLITRTPTDITDLQCTGGHPFSGTTGTAFLSGTGLSRDILIAFIGSWRMWNLPSWLEAISSQLFFLTSSKLFGGA